MTLRIYDGRSFADGDHTIAQVRKKKGTSKGLSVAKNMLVGNLEKKFEEDFGLKIQIAGSDDSYLCSDDLTLKAAFEKDGEKLGRKSTKERINDEAELEDALSGTSDSVNFLSDIMEETNARLSGNKGLAAISRIFEEAEFDPDEDVPDEKAIRDREDVDHNLKEVTWVVRDDREVVMAAVKEDGFQLASAGDSLKADREIVLTAVTNMGDVLEYVEANLKADREIVLTAVTNSGGALEYADDSLKADREVVLAAVHQDGWALDYANDSLKADREVVLAAVTDRADALDYADDSLKADREVVLAAVHQDGSALEYADDSLKADREVVLAALKQNGYALVYADDSLKADREVVLAAVKDNPWMLKEASEELQQDEELRKIAEE